MLPIWSQRRQHWREVNQKRLGSLPLRVVSWDKFLSIFPRAQFFFAFAFEPIACSKTRLWKKAYFDEWWSHLVPYSLFMQRKMKVLMQHRLHHIETTWRVFLILSWWNTFSIAFRYVCVQFDVHGLLQCTELYFACSSGRGRPDHSVEPASVSADVQTCSGDRVRQHGRLQTERDDIGDDVDVVRHFKTGRSAVITTHHAWFSPFKKIFLLYRWLLERETWTLTTSTFTDHIRWP